MLSGEVCISIYADVIEMLFESLQFELLTECRYYCIIISVIVLQILVRTATGGVPAGTPFFYMTEGCN